MREVDVGNNYAGGRTHPCSFEEVTPVDLLYATYSTYRSPLRLFSLIVVPFVALSFNEMEQRATRFSDSDNFSKRFSQLVRNV